jgi:hypothetical protein
MQCIVRNFVSVARTGEIKNAYSIFLMKHHGKCLLGGEESIKMDFGLT